MKTVVLHCEPMQHYQQQPYGWLVVEKGKVSYLLDTWNLYDRAYLPGGGIVTQEKWLNIGIEALLIKLRIHTFRTLVMTDSVWEELKGKFLAPTIPVDTSLVRTREVHPKQPRVVEFGDGNKFVSSESGTGGKIEC